MYYAAIATFFGFTIFIPSFIGIRARTNANWRTRINSRLSRTSHSR